jgi:hypothetical protein
MSGKKLLLDTNAVIGLLRGDTGISSLARDAGWENIKDAVKCHFDEKDMPHSIRLHTVKDEVMAL